MQMHKYYYHLLVVNNIELTSIHERHHRKKAFIFIFARSYVRGENIKYRMAGNIGIKLNLAVGKITMRQQIL